jgi:DNA-directed RNA polymerase
VRPKVEALRDDELRAKEVRGRQQAAIPACAWLTATGAQAGEPSSFQRVLDALNVLGNTKWCVHNSHVNRETPSVLNHKAACLCPRRVNEEVLKTMEQVWDMGGGIVDIPAAQVCARGQRASYPFMPS